MYCRQAFRRICQAERLILKNFETQQARTAAHQSRLVDPFGLANEDHSEIEKLIKGVYSPAHPLGKDSEDVFNSRSPETQPTESIETRFENIPKTAVERELSKDLRAEKVYTSHFGNLRLDEDNVVQLDGQYDTDFSELETPIEELLHAQSQSLTAGEAGLQQHEVDAIYDNLESLTHGIKTRHWKKLKPVQSKPEYLKEEIAAAESEPEAADTQESSDAHEENQKVSDQLLMKKPKTAAEYLRLQQLKESAATAPKTKVGGKTFDLPETSHEDAKRHVPTIYDPFNYDKLTHDDVWNLLKNKVCFQNDFLIAFNKPRGLPMHTASKECRHTIIDFLSEMANFAKVDKIYPCHRLDKDTTGVLIFAKSEDAADVIRNKFKTRSIHKQYFAITKNCPAVREATISIPIGLGKVGKTDVVRRVVRPDLQKFKISSKQSGCEEAITKYRVLASQEWAALLDVRPITGVTHQIRVHLSRAVGCPILGDHKYSHTEKMAPQRLHEEALRRLKVKQSKVRLLPLHLHCSRLEFEMPEGFLKNPLPEPIFIHARPPSFFLHSMAALGLKHR